MPQKFISQSRVLGKLLISTEYFHGCLFNVSDVDNFIKSLIIRMMTMPKRMTVMMMMVMPKRMTVMMAESLFTSWLFCGCICICAFGFVCLYLCISAFVCLYLCVFAFVAFQIEAVLQQLSEFGLGRVMRGRP